MLGFIPAFHFFWGVGLLVPNQKKSYPTTHAKETSGGKTTGGTDSRRKRGRIERR